MKHYKVCFATQNPAAFFQQKLENIDQHKS